jgi:hypothetical protein
MTATPCVEPAMDPIEVDRKAVAMDDLGFLLDPADWSPGVWHDVQRSVWGWTSGA